MGSMILLIVLAGFGTGLYVDSRASTSPLFTFIGLGLGIVLAWTYAFVKFRKFLKE